jgi:putative aldouronate transport system substrate-binding protein
MKKLTALFLAICLVFTACACGGKEQPKPKDTSQPETETASVPDNEDENTENEAPAEPEKIVYVYMTQNNMPETGELERIQKLLNEYTIEKINTEVELVLFSNSDYSTQLNLRLAGNEQSDLYRSMLSGYSTIDYIKDGSALDITDYLSTHLADAVDVMYDGLLATSTVNGRVYGLNVVTSNYVPRGWCYRTDIIEELDIDLSQVSSVFDLTDVFARVKEAYPDMVLCDPNRANVAFQAYLQDTLHMDPLGGDSSNAFSGVVMGDDATVVNLYEREEFKAIASLMREWYQAGYFPSDAATSTATTAELASSGNLFSMFAGLGNPKIAATFTSNYGYSYDSITISEAYSLSTTYDVWMINANCKAPEAAAKFLNLTFTDPYVYNLLTYGEEGTDYTLDENGCAVAPEGYDSLADVPYTNNLNYPYFGNKWLAYPVPGGLTGDAFEENKQQNYSAKLSEFYGFVYDNSEVEAEYLACSNIAEEYKKAVWVGSLELDQAIDDLNSKLYAAGLQKVLDSKQTQLDAWLGN